MSRRALAALVAALTALSGIVVGVMTPLPAAAAPVPLDMEMVADSGELLVRDAEEPFLLESPTRVTGTIDTDQISGATLTTPTISFQQPVAGGALTADVDVAFSQVTPGSATGTLGPDGAFTLQTALRADIHVEVPAAGLSGDCVAAPVQLELSSLEPYSEETGLVTVSDADFTIPSIPVTAQCENAIASGLNESLAGSGHSLVLTLDGDLEVPEIGTEDSETTLVVSPEGGAALGQEVTFTATVAPGDTESTEVPTGLVDIMDGQRMLGQASLVDGIATFTTVQLGLGALDLRARYRGDSLYLSSESTVVPYTVTASPTVTAELPDYATIGGDPVTFDAVTENPSVGTAVANARIDVTISRYDPSGFSFDALAPEDVVLELETAPDTWEPVPLTQVSGTTTPTLTGSIGALSGRPLPAGDELADRLRLSFPNGSPQTIPGSLSVELAVVAVDPDTGSITRELSSTNGRIGLFLPGRVQTEIDLADFGDFGEAYGPTTIRQGGTIATTLVTIMPSFGGTRPTGTLRAAIDGQQVPLFGTFPGDLASPTPNVLPLDPGCGCNTVLVDLPTSVGVGEHTLTFTYSGDDQFTPSTRSAPFTVMAPISDPYRCEMDIFGASRRFNVQLRTFGRMPTTRTDGSTVRLGEYSFEIVADRSYAEWSAFDFLVGGAVTFTGLTIDLGAGGTGSATQAVFDPPAFQGGPSQADDPDISVRFTDAEASVPVTGAPGSVITPAVEGFALTSDAFGIPLAMSCTPLADPVAYGSTTVAGTVLTVEGPDPARADDELGLTAAVFPTTASGTVQFRDGDVLLAIAPVVDGVATSTVTLPAGDHSITARFLAGASAPSTTSAAVPLTVRPAVECASSADEGNGAAVRLVYLELLERCPDAAGYEYWTTQLDEGAVTRQQFARQISSSFEARRVLVNDAYLLMLGRPAEPAGKDFWGARLATTRYDRLLADLAASGEFWTLAGETAEGFVDRVYERLLQRTPEPAGLAYWADRLEEGGSRRELVGVLANLTEPLQAVVGDAYGDILGRTPGTSELASGVTLLKSTGSRSLLLGSLIGTADFFNRAQQLPNPED